MIETAAVERQATPALPSVVGVAGCATSFGEDVAFLGRHTQTIVLSDASGAARVALCPALQGRVCTSTAAGAAGPSFGWLNRELIASGAHVPHMNVYGGEDRFWLGPEGGQFSLFFAPGAPQDLAHWQTPAPIDSEAFTLIEKGDDRALLRKTMRLINASGTVFDLDVDREVRLYSVEQTFQEAGVPGQEARVVGQEAGMAGHEVSVAGRNPPVAAVGFESRNRITNRGVAPWRHDTGLISIWIAGTFCPSPTTTIVVPFRPGPQSDLGPIVNDKYFGQVPSDRLAIDDRAIYFRGDGRQRGKIGVSPLRARPVIGSYTPSTAGRSPSTNTGADLLTIVTFTLPAGASEYVNSLWEPQHHPFAGDTINAYNDGPSAPGAAPFGPFYELESSSPAAALSPGESVEHVHKTLHFLGAPKDLDPIARNSLGVTLTEITSALPR